MIEFHWFENFCTFPVSETVSNAMNRMNVCQGWLIYCPANTISEFILYFWIFIIYSKKYQCCALSYHYCWICNLDQETVPVTNWKCLLQFDINLMQFVMRNLQRTNFFQFWDFAMERDLTKFSHHFFIRKNVIYQSILRWKDHFNSQSTHFWNDWPISTHI